METQCINDGYDVASESSLSWSGGEGHEGDDELTDWAPSLDNSAVLEQSQWPPPGIDPREIRAGKIFKYAHSDFYLVIFTVILTLIFVKIALFLLEKKGCAT